MTYRPRFGLIFEKKELTRLSVSQSLGPGPNKQEPPNQSFPMSKSECRWRTAYPTPISSMRRWRCEREEESNVGVSFCFPDWEPLQVEGQRVSSWEFRVSSSDRGATPRWNGRGRPFPHLVFFSRQCDVELSPRGVTGVTRKSRWQCR